MRDRGRLGWLFLNSLVLAACSGGDTPGGFGGFGDQTGTGMGPTGDGGDDGGDGGDGSGDDGSGGTGGGGTGSGDDGGTAECGNGTVEAGEACDGSDLAGATCASEGFDDGALACNDDCTFDTSSCTGCGNGTVEGDEECDGTDLGASATCADVGLGASDEDLACNADCTYDYSACGGCPDGMITAPEECEPANGLNPPDVGGETCEGLGHDGGTLGCTAGCTYDESECHTCGDAVAGGPEECDDADFASQTCANFNAGSGQPFDDGTLACNADCTVDTSGCSLCGDGAITGDEVCDGTELGSATCMTEGFTDGTLACNATCDGFVTSSCTTCGDGTKEGAEACDDTDFGSTTCETLGFDTGTLSCESDCQINASGCAGFTCGDGSVNANDECDCGLVGAPCTPDQLDNKLCADLPAPGGGNYSGGVLRCNSPNLCTYDTSGCWYCGDDTQNGSEQCDGSDLPTTACTAVPGNFTAGTVTCDDDCTYDTSDCTTCGDGNTETGEDCDQGVGSDTCQDIPGNWLSGGTLACNDGTCEYDTSGCVPGDLNNTNDAACDDYLSCPSAMENIQVECFPSPPVSTFDITNFSYDIALANPPQPIPSSAELRIYAYADVMAGGGTPLHTQALTPGTDLTVGSHSVAITPMAYNHTGAFCIGIQADTSFTFARAPQSGINEAYLSNAGCGLSMLTNVTAVPAMVGGPFYGDWCVTVTIEE